MHVLLFIDAGTAPEHSVKGLGDALTAEWARLVTAAGYRASTNAQKLLEPTEEHLSLMSGYFTKQLADGLAWEMTGQATKRTRGESRNPAELLAAAVEGDMEARAAWQELEEATKGRRMIAYSAHCRLELALPRTATLDEAVVEEPLSEVETLVHVGREDWEEHSSRFGWREALAAVVESAQHPEEVLWWLHERGVRASLAPDRLPQPPRQPPQAGPAGQEWLATV